MIFVGGKPRPIGPWGEWKDLSAGKRDSLIALALDEAARSISNKKTREQVRSVLIKAAARHVEALIKDKATGRKRGAAKDRAASAPVVGLKQSMMLKRSELLKK